MKRSWIKLYIEILHDRKMNRLPEHLWKRAIELFLFAGEVWSDGDLPPVQDMAWDLRTTVEELTTDLRALAEVGVVVEAQPGQWVVVNFGKRQAAISDAERAQTYRKRHERVTGNVTKRDDERHEAAVTDSSSSSYSSSVSVSQGGGVGEGEVFKSYEANITALVPITCDALGADIDDYGADWVIAAIEYAARQQKPSLAYIEGTLKGWKRDGITDPSKRNGNGKRAEPKETKAAAAARSWAEKNGVEING